MSQPNQEPQSVITDELLRERIRQIVTDIKQPPVLIRLSTNTLVAGLITVLVAGSVGAFLTYRYEVKRVEREHALASQRADIERQAKLTESEVARSFEVFDHISRLLDRRLYRTMRRVWGHKNKVSGEEMEKRNNAYREVLYEWNENLNRNLSLTQRYFGEGMRKVFENYINRDFVCLQELLDKDKPDLAVTEKKLYETNKYVYAFNVEMLARIQERRVGMLSTDLDRMTQPIPEPVDCKCEEPKICKWPLPS